MEQGETFQSNWRVRVISSASTVVFYPSLLFAREDRESLLHLLVQSGQCAASCGDSASYHRRAAATECVRRDRATTSLLPANACNLNRDIANTTGQALRRHRRRNLNRHKACRSTIVRDVCRWSVR